MKKNENELPKEKSYGFALGWKIFLITFLAVLMVPMAYVGYLPFKEGMGVYLTILLILTALGGIALLVLGILLFIKSKIIIGEDYIIERGLFNEKKIALDEIMGYKVIEQLGIRLCTKNKKRKIDLSIYSEKMSELAEWADCPLDRSQAKVYWVDVVDKHISTGKTTTYYLTVPPWGIVKKQSDITVDKVLYNDIEIGDKISLYLKEGFLGVKWFIPYK